jgi:hypothetical protein
MSSVAVVWHAEPVVDGLGDADADGDGDGDDVLLPPLS